MTFSIRAAIPTDVPAIQAIYAHHVLTGTGTSEIDPPDIADIEARVDKVAARGWPWLVSVDAGGIDRGVYRKWCQGNARRYW